MNENLLDLAGILEGVADTFRATSKDLARLSLSGDPEGVGAALTMIALALKDSDMSIRRLMYVVSEYAMR